MRTGIERLLEAATLAPTSFNLQHWRFVVIDDCEQLKLIVDRMGACPGMRFPAAIVLVCARISVWQDVLSYNPHLPPEGKERVCRNCDKIYNGHERVQRDEACRSGGLVAATLMELLHANGIAFEYIADIAACELDSLAGLENDSFVASAIAIQECAGAMNGSAVMDSLPGVAAVQTRRAIKYFDSSHRLSEELFSRIMASISALPPGIEIRPVVIVDVADPGMRENIARVGFAQPQFTEASRLLLLCYDLGAAEGAFKQRDYAQQRDAAMICAGLVAQRIMLGAAKLGIDSCPMIGFDYEEVGKLLGKPETHLILMAVALGKRRQDPPGRAPRSRVKDFVTYNSLRI